MSPSILPVLLVAALVATAIGGPRLIRTAAPALARYPRTAIGFLAGGVGAWLTAFMSIGPLFAWMVTGRGGGGASPDLCRRCLESSNPWAEPIFDTALPTTVILAGPAVLAVAAVATVVVRTVASGIDSRRNAWRIRLRGHSERVRGRRVLVTPDSSLEVFTLPNRQVGIVMSRGALHALDADELDAVLAHEEAHLTQHHHLIAVLSAHIEHVLRPIPFIRAAAAAIPLYLEVAADNAARDRTGTRALVNALLRLSCDQEPSSASRMPVGSALYAVSPHRIRTLVSDDSSPRSRRTVIATSAQSAVLVVLTAAVGLPWLVAMTSGCA